jgi:hypothetical protein
VPAPFRAADPENTAPGDTAPGDTDARDTDHGDTDAGIPAEARPLTPGYPGG